MKQSSLEKQREAKSIGSVYLVVRVLREKMKQLGDSVCYYIVISVTFSSFVLGFFFLIVILIPIKKWTYVSLLKVKVGMFPLRSGCWLIFLMLWGQSLLLGLYKVRTITGVTRYKCFFFNDKRDYNYWKCNW